MNGFVKHFNNTETKLKNYKTAKKVHQTMGKNQDLNW